MKTKMRLNLGFLLSMVLLMVACGGVTRSDKPASSTWLLKPYEGSAATSGTQPATPVAISVQVTPGLDSDWILTLSEDAQLSHFAGARWVDHLPELLESLIGRTLTASGRFEVITEISAGNKACELHLEVQEFYASIRSEGQTSAVRVAINGQYQCEAAESVPLQLSATVPVHEERISVIVAAFQQATDSVMKELLEQL